MKAAIIILILMSGIQYNIKFNDEKIISMTGWLFSLIAAILTYFYL